MSIHQLFELLHQTLLVWSKFYSHLIYLSKIIRLLIGFLLVKQYTCRRHYRLVDGIFFGVLYEVTGVALLLAIPFVYLRG